MAHYVYPAANAAQQAPAYPAAVQTAFVAATPQAAAYATAPRAGQAYDAYQTQHTTPQYAYARTQVAVTVCTNTGIYHTQSPAMQRHCRMMLHLDLTPLKAGENEYCEILIAF